MVSDCIDNLEISQAVFSFSIDDLFTKSRPTTDNNN